MEKLEKQDKFQPKDKSYLYNIPSLKQNRWRMVPLQTLQIQKRLLFRYVS